jgi:hypothetical protein
MKDGMPTERPRPAAPEPRRPYHVGVAIGLTTGVYAMSLLATTSMQIDQDRALIADRDPVVSAIEALDVHHDLMESRLLEARLRYQDGTTRYETLADRLTALHERLAAMDTTVAAVERLSASLPSDLSLPNVPMTTGRGSSSGGGSSGGSASSGSRPVVNLPSVPAAPAAKPPTSASTGASGVP